MYIHLYICIFIYIYIHTYIPRCCRRRQSAGAWHPRCSCARLPQPRSCSHSARVQGSWRGSPATRPPLSLETHTDQKVGTCVYIYACMYVYIICIYKCIFLCIYIYENMYVRIYVCMYVYIYIYIYIKRQSRVGTHHCLAKCRGRLGLVPVVGLGDEYIYVHMCKYKHIYTYISVHLHIEE